jgi:hypothetical protein
MISRLMLVLKKLKMSLYVGLSDIMLPSNTALDRFRLRIGLTHNQFCYAANFLKIHETRTLNVSHRHHV